MRKSNQTIYKIKIINWEKHNKGHKKTYRKTMIANNFCTDSKLGVLPVTHRWLFLGLLLECGSTCRDYVEMTERQLRVLLESSKSVSRALDRLQSLQLLTYEVFDPLMNRIELNRIELNRIESTPPPEVAKPKRKKSPSNEVAKISVAEPVDDLKAVASEVWKVYCEAYKFRYKVAPVRNARVNSQISQLAKRLGREAAGVVGFFMKHNDSFYVSKTHSIGLCLRDAESLRTQWLRGAQITKSGMKRFEQSIAQQELYQAIDAGQV